MSTGAARSVEELTELAIQSRMSNGATREEAEAWLQGLFDESIARQIAKHPPTFTSLNAGFHAPRPTATDRLQAKWRKRRAR